MIKFNTKIDLNGVKKKLERSQSLGQEALDSQALKDSNFYAPEDQGDLQDSGIRHSKPGEGKLIWDTPYAKRLYKNPQYNFLKDKNPNAGGLWFEVAKSRHVKDWERIIKGRIDKG